LDVRRIDAALARVLSTAFVVVLLCATAGAFALTQGAKLERSPIYRTHVGKVFSPGEGGAPVQFSLRKGERVSVWVERNGKRVATISPERRLAAGRVRLAFDGFTESGRVLPDGLYEPVVHLAQSHKTIRLPNRIRLDSKPPVITVKHPQHALISPDGDGRKDVFRTRYTVSEPAHAILYVNHRRVLYTLRKPLSGELHWNGKFGARGARPGNYLLESSATDTAGNRAEPTPFAIVQVRYVALGRKRVIARPGGRFAIRVSTDAPTVRWKLHGRTGVARRGTLHLRAPRSKGVFKLYVIANGHAAKAAVVVA
jgi:hypothetical protein